MWVGGTTPWATVNEKRKKVICSSDINQPPPAANMGSPAVCMLAWALELLLVTKGRAVEKSTPFLISTTLRLAFP